MGFSWGLEVSVKYALLVERPFVLTRFAKRCVYFGNALVARSEMAAAAVGMERQRLAVFADKIPNEKPPSEENSSDEDSSDEDGGEETRSEDDSSQEDSSQEDSSEDDSSQEDLGDGDCFSDVPEHSDLEASQIELLEQIRETCEFDLEYNDPDMISAAFAMASRAILGCDHGLEFEVFRGGANGEASDGAAAKMFVISFSDWNIEQTGCMDVSRRHDNVDVPWGCSATEIATPDTEECAAVDEKMKRVCDALGLVPVGLPSFKLLTVADGG
jgi:hypothetical protein